MSSTPVIASVSASSKAVRSSPSSPASTSSFPRMSTLMFAVPSAEVPRLLQNLEASAGAPSLSDDAMETESAATPTQSETDRLLQVSVVISPINTHRHRLLPAQKMWRWQKFQTPSRRCPQLHTIRLLRVQALPPKLLLQDSKSVAQKRNRRMVRLLELEKEMAKVKSSLSKQTEAAERRQTSTDLRLKLPQSNTKTKSSADAKDTGSKKQVKSIVLKNDNSGPRQVHREDSSRHSLKRTHRSERHPSEALSANRSHRTSSSHSCESTDFFPGRVFCGRGHYALDFQRSSKGSAVETPGRFHRHCFVGSITELEQGEFFLQQCSA